MSSYKSTKVLRLGKDNVLSRGEKRNISNVSMSSISDNGDSFNTSTPIAGAKLDHMKTSDVLAIFDSINEKLRIGYFG